MDRARGYPRETRAVPVSGEGGCRAELKRVCWKQFVCTTLTTLNTYTNTQYTVMVIGVFLNIKQNQLLSSIAPPHTPKTDTRRA